MTNLLKASLPISIITLLCFSPVALFAQPQPPKSDKEESREGIKEKIVKDLGLTEAQQAKFSEHRKNTESRRKELRQTLRESEKQLREELAKYNADQGKIQVLATTIKKDQVEMIDSRIADIAALKSILTKEQFEKLQEKAKARTEAMKTKKEGHKKTMDCEKSK